MSSIIYDWIKSFFRKNEGQTLSEYALILFLVALAVIVTLTALGVRIDVIFQDIITGLGGAGAGG